LGSIFQNKDIFLAETECELSFLLTIFSKKQQSISTLVEATIFWMSCGSSLKSSGIYIVEGKKEIVK